MKKFIILTSLFIAFSASAKKKICFTSEIGFSIDNLQNWNNESDAGGFCGLQVLEGFKIDDSPAIMYPKLKKLTSRETKEKVIELELKQLSEANKKLKIKDLKSYVTKSGLEFELKELIGQNTPKGYEIFAYHLKKSSLLQIIFNAGSEKNFEKYKADFYMKLQLSLKGQNVSFRAIKKSSCYLKSVVNRKFQTSTRTIITLLRPV